jgi:hypothetical protein
MACTPSPELLERLSARPADHSPSVAQNVTRDYRKPTPKIPPSTLDLGAASLKGPLYYNDCAGWSGDVGGNAPAPSPPNWCMGSGFGFTDNVTALPVPRYYVESASVNFQIDSSFTDDTGSMSFPVAFPDGDWNTVYQSMSWLDYYAAGNQGAFDLDIQEWRPFCSEAKTPNCLDPSTYQCPQPEGGIDGDQPPIVFDTSPDGSSGCWVDANQAPTTTMLYGSSVTGFNGFTAQQDGTVTVATVAPVQLRQVSTFVRALVGVKLGDTRTITPWPTWDKGTELEHCYIGESECGCEACIMGPDNNGDTVCPAGYHTFAVGYPRAGGFQYRKAFSPVQVVVMPLAVAQLKVIPYTIVYQPPGDFSQATFKTSTSYGVSMTAGVSTQGTSTTIVDTTGSVGTSWGIGGKTEPFQLSTDEGIDTIPAGMISISGGGSSSQKWDHNTNIGVGRSNTAGASSGATWLDSYKWTSNDSSQTPGAAGPYSNEPFWGDKFVFVIHPQYAFWTDLGGQPTISLLGALGSTTSPDWFTLTVRALDDCYNQAPGYENGILIPDSGGEYLAKDECYQFLRLDPFWTVGQSIPQWTDLSLRNDWRAQFSTAIDYGIPGSCATAPGPCASDLSFTLDDLNTQTSVQTTGQGSTLSVAVSDIIGNSFAANMNLSVFGVSLGQAFQGGENTTTGAKMDLTLTESVTATAQTSTEITGVLDDHHGIPGDKGASGTGSKYLGYTPRVYIYKDKLFGSYMFQDKQAPLDPAGIIPLVYDSGDERVTNVEGDWFPGSYKAECGVGQPVVGLSRDTNSSFAHTALCSSASAAQYPHASCRALDFGGADNRGDTTTGDWDPGYVKGECAGDEYVAGASQTTDGKTDGILCCKGGVTHNACLAHTFADSDARESTVTGDWDYAHFKGECGGGRYVAGVSAALSDGGPHTILCCTP